MSIPFFYPPPIYRENIDITGAKTIAELCDLAGVTCRASGNWVQRKIAIRPGSELIISAEPNEGAVEIITPPINNQQKMAQLVLGVLAFGLHDLVAKQSIAGQLWTRVTAPAGRPSTGMAMTNAERQRRHRRKIV